MQTAFRFEWLKSRGNEYEKDFSTKSPSNKYRYLKYLGCVVSENGADDADIESKLMQSRKVACTIKAIISTKNLGCVRLLNERMPVAKLVYGNETFV